MHKLSLSHISHLYENKNKVLADVNFAINPAELTCLVGPSGSGKSTLLRLIAGLEKVQSGEIQLGDKILANSHLHIPVQQRRIGLVFQQTSLFPHLNIKQNIAFGLHKMVKAEKEQIVNDLLKMINLEKYADRYPHTLSGGQQQRVAIARCLAPKPEIVLLDEPFANLDNKLRREIAAEIISILKKANIAVLMVTHEPEEALILADKMVLLNSTGTVCQIGTPSVIHNQPVNIEAAAFFGIINVFHAEVKDAYIESKIGKLAKKDYLPDAKNNTKVKIVTRPEGVRISNNQGAKVRISKVMHSGAGWLLAAEIDGREINFHHIYGKCPNVGDEVNIAFEPPHIFVF